MKAIYLDCFSGISGNMLLGAFLQAGVPLAHLTSELRKLPWGREYEIVAEPVKKQGIAATYVRVLLSQDEQTPSLPAHHHHHHHEHRTMADICQLIEASSLSESVKARSLSIFGVLAAAEGKVHGKPQEDVAFHEVGAVDSIVDIVGTAVCLEYLGIEKIFASRVNTGSGFVHCAHGIMPVPAPAVSELLLGWPSYHAGAEKELTTPTGAAVLRSQADFAASLPDSFVAARIAYGAGTWDTEIPNVLRLYLGDYAENQEGAQHAADILLLETNIDDMESQIFGYLYERLFAAGALDVWTTPIVMKKTRPAYQLSVLCRRKDKADCATVILRESTSIGLRIFRAEERLEAERKFIQAATPYGEVTCKLSSWQGRILGCKPEYEDCCRLARKYDIPLKRVEGLASMAVETIAYDKQEMESEKNALHRDAAHV